jgi:exodeoxyribonuclease VII large subunit
VALIRGGGSKADLECFNDYELAYYITQFPLPVITGIGHERDESVADMVAARGLKTPTAVAEFLVDQLLAFEFRLGELDEKLGTVVQRIVQLHAGRLDRYRSDLSHLVRRLLFGKSEQLNQFRMLTAKQTRNLLSRKKDQLLLLETRAQLVDPAHILKRGYSITLLHGRAIRDIHEVKPGSELETRVHRGTLISRTTRILDGKKKPAKGKDRAEEKEP